MIGSMSVDSTLAESRLIAAFWMFASARSTIISLQLTEAAKTATPAMHPATRAAARSQGVAVRGFGRLAVRGCIVWGTGAEGVQWALLDSNQ